MIFDSVADSVESDEQGLAMVKPFTITGTFVLKPNRKSSLKDTGEKCVEKICRKAGFERFEWM